MRYVKVKVACLDKQMEKNVNKTFFVDAVSFADAEKRFMNLLLLYYQARKQM